MAENGNDNNSEQTRMLLDFGLKIFLFYQGAKIVKNAIAAATGAGGSTDRVKFDFDKTQVRLIPISTDPVEYEEISDPWNPADIARRFSEVVKGWTADYSDHIQIYQEIRQLGKDRARWLHNYWLDVHDPSETIFRWIDGEAPNELSSEGEEQEKTKEVLRRWGIGF